MRVSDLHVGDVMERKVVSATLDTSVRAAFQLMRDGGFRHLPVLTSSGELAGIVSDRDLRAVGAVYTDDDTGLEELLVTEEMTVDKVMSENPLTVSPDTSIAQAVKLIKEWRIGCLIVIEDGQLVGILSYLDVLDAAMTAFEGPAQGKSSVTEEQPMGEQELSELRKQMKVEQTKIGASQRASNDEDINQSG